MLRVNSRSRKRQHTRVLLNRHANYAWREPYRKGYVVIAVFRGDHERLNLGVRGDYYALDLKPVYIDASNVAVFTSGLRNILPRSLV